MPTLILVRHAKSAYPPGAPDHDRPLNDRGVREAQVMADCLAERFDHVDLVVVSTARRAQQTWQAIARALQTGVQRHSDDLYLADVEELLAIVRALPDEPVVMLVGHNDGLQSLASALTGVPVVLKTSTFAVVGSGRVWSEWEPGVASLDEVVVAR